MVVGPVTVNVTSDGIELQHKRRTGPPRALRTHELTTLVSALDRWYVSVNDIIGLLAQMNERNALGAPLYWAE